jgi:hypothetical protein
LSSAADCPKGRGGCDVNAGQLLACGETADWLRLLYHNLPIIHDAITAKRLLLFLSIIDIYNE